jgi:AraC family transcriptional regulator of adaptative response / DNA-3-methyladenine glycosylase II
MPSRSPEPDSVLLAEAECERAWLARDPAYDGRFFILVRTTRVYCRPVCPVRLPLRRNVGFAPSAAAAEAAGFRPCLRCRPETAPFCPAWNGSRATVARALRLIEGGAMDHEGATVEALAARVRRAKRLLDATDLPMVEVAARAGFGSLRRFNAVFAEVYRRPPTMIRRRGAAVAPAV